MNTLFLASAAASEGLEISIDPRSFYIGGVDVSLSAVMGSVIVLILVALMWLLNKRIAKFTDQPKGLQNVVELAVDAMYKFAKGKVGHVADIVAPYVMALMMYIMFGTLVELIGLPAVTGDLSCTIALGLMSFVMTNVIALKVLGIKGRVHKLASPIKMAFPIKVLTDCVAPFSMALRLFANVLVGAIIMELIYYAMGVLPLGIPAVVASYFSLAHTLIQVYVYGLLSLNYINEAIE